MRLISHRADDGGERLGVATSERWLPADTLLLGGPRTIEELLARGPALVAALEAAADPAEIDRTGTPLAETELLAPVPRPGKIVAIGRNYREHVDEEGTDPPPAPLIFAKWPSSVVGHGAEIRWDPELATQVDYEAELAVVIGRPARRVRRRRPSTTSSGTPV